MLYDFISLFYPDLCIACEKSLNKGENQICVACLFELPETNNHLERENILTKKFYGKIKIKRAMAFYQFKKGSKVQKIMHKLKYKEAKGIGDVLGRNYGLKLKKDGLFELFDIIIPVPLHKNKLKKRGFNQASVISKGISEGLNVPVDNNILVRNVYTKTQTKRNRVDRWKNVKNVFGTINSYKIKGKRVLIVDDIITTGATIGECAIILLTNGASEVSVACLAMSE